MSAVLIPSASWLELDRCCYATLRSPQGKKHRQLQPLQLRELLPHVWGMIHAQEIWILARHDHSSVCLLPHPSVWKQGFGNWNWQSRSRSAWPLAAFDRERKSSATRAAFSKKGTTHRTVFLSLWIAIAPDRSYATLFFPIWPWLFLKKDKNLPTDSF